MVTDSGVSVGWNGSVIVVITLVCRIARTTTGISAVGVVSSFVQPKVDNWSGGHDVVCANGLSTTGYAIVVVGKEGGDDNWFFGL